MIVAADFDQFSQRRHRCRGDRNQLLLEDRDRPDALEQERLRHGRHIDLVLDKSTSVGLLAGSAYASTCSFSSPLIGGKRFSRPDAAGAVGEVSET